MREIVDATMESFKSDFENYDRRTILKAEDSDFPMFWIVSKRHTYLLGIGHYANMFNQSESVRLEYAQNHDVCGVHFNTIKNDDKLFLITSDDIAPISVDEARQIQSNILTPVVEAWEAENGPLPKRFKVKVKFNGITISELKALILDGEAHGDTSLIDSLRRFHRHTQVALDQYVSISYDRRYNEFGFVEIINGTVRLRGGIIFHGWPETGYQTNNSVQIEPRYGWSTHT